MVFNLFVCKLFSISEGLPGQPIKQIHFCCLRLMCKCQNVITCQAF
ncbi:unnamed protein product [Tenebrio molitor]|nr:unnamed protein product [Tenebrio molitor]